MKPLRVFAAPLLAACLLVTPLAAQTRPLSADDQALRSYRLTLDKVEKMNNALLAVAAQNDPALRAELAKNSSLMTKGSLSDIERLMNADMPRFTAALGQHGLTPRDYALTTLVLFQSAFIAATRKSGDLTQLPHNANPENVEFVTKNEAALKALTDKAQAAYAKLKPATTDDDDR